MVLFHVLECDIPVVVCFSLSLNVGDFVRFVPASAMSKNMSDALMSQERYISERWP